MLQNPFLSHLPKEKSQLIEELIDELRNIPSIGAIVLGGSYARCTQTENSDLDVALYYSETSPFSIEEIWRVAASISMAGEPTVTGFYEWGA